MSLPKCLISVVGRLLYWDGRKAHTVLEAEERVFGVTWDERRVYVAAGRHPGRVLVLDGRLHTIEGFGVREGDLWDLHQLFWHGGVLHVVETGRNTLHRVGLKRIGWEMRGYCAPNDDPHINSIWGNGRRHWVVEHWNACCPKRVRVFDQCWRTLTVHEFHEHLFPARVKSGLHNVFVEGGILYVLSPDAVLCKRLALDQIERHPIHATLAATYLRGLARDKDGFYIGVSKYRESRPDRHHGDAAVAVLDDTLALRDLVVLEDAGEVYEIRLLNGDWAHNVLPCPFQGGAR